MRVWKYTLRAFLAGLAASAAFSAPASASSPEFARSAEEWAQLKDNKIEYGELEGLIEEYNATEPVQLPEIPG